MKVVLAFLAALLVASQDVCPTWSLYPPQFFVHREHCTRIGLGDTRPFRHGLQYPSSFFPYFGSVALEEKNPHITQAVVTIHGLNLDAEQFFCDGVDAARKGGSDHSTATIVPWFGSVRMKPSAWQPAWDNHTRTSMCWKWGEWLLGSDSWADPGAEHVASFKVLDHIVELLHDKSNFPNLRQVTMAGFSAGCQTISRWALFSPTASKVVSLVGDCATYVYLDHYRPAGSCSPLADTGVHHGCGHFTKPDTKVCPDFNVYKNGLTFATSERMSYFVAYMHGKDELEKVLAAFPSKDLRFLLGVHDVCQCNVPGMHNEPHCFHKAYSCLPTIQHGCCDTSPDSTTYNVMDFTCGAQLEGSNRLQRGLNYVAYLRQFFDKRGAVLEPPVAFFGGGGSHNSTAWALSPQFAQWVGWTPAREPRDRVLLT